MFLCNYKKWFYAIGSFIILTAIALSCVRIWVNTYPPKEALRDYIIQASPYPLAIQTLEIDWHKMAPIVTLSGIALTLEEDAILNIEEARLHFHLGALFQGHIKAKTENLHFQKIQQGSLEWAGYVRGLAVHTSVLNSKQLELDFKDLSLLLLKSQSRVAHLTGKFRLEGEKKIQAQLKLNSPELVLEEPRLFEEALTLTHVQGLFEIGKRDENWEVLASSFKATSQNTHIQGKAKVTFMPDKTLPVVDGLLEVGNINVMQALKLLPRVWMNAQVTKWLDSAIEDGEIVSSAMVLRGDLEDFPFDHHEGVFEVVSEVENLSLNYDTHWPSLKDVKAHLLFRNRSMHIDGESAQFEGGWIKAVDVHIPDLGADFPKLLVNAKIESTLNEGKAVLLNSPLKEKIGQHLIPFQMEGPMMLSLGLMIPLSDSSPDTLKVDGTIAVSDASMGIEKSLGLENMLGEIQFSQAHIAAKGLQAKLLGGDCHLLLQADFSKDSHIHLESQGNLSLDQLAKWQKISLEALGQGKTNYKATIDYSPHDKNQNVVILESALKGIAIKAPYPFSKQAEEEKPFKCQLFFEPQDILRLSLQYGKEVDLAYSLKNEKSFRTLGGHLNFGDKKKALFREDGIFLIDGEIKEINFDAWKHFFNQWKLSMGKEVVSFEPLVALEVENLVLNELPFHHTKIDAEWESYHQRWNIQCEGPSILGSILLSKDKQKDLRIQLQRLVLNTQDLQQVSHLNHKDTLEPLEQKVHVTIENCRINQLPLNQLTLKLSSAPKGYLIDEFSTIYPGGDVHLTGRWEMITARSEIEMKGKLKLDNTSEFLKALERPKSIDKAKGVVDFNLAWLGLPFKLDYPSLTGNVDLRLQKGSILGMNSGLGRVLNLLNLDNLIKRLNFDFSDVTKSGFAFKALNGRLQFGNGKVSSNDIMINGASAKIVAYGQADLITQAVRGQLIVMPDLTSSLPMVAALAVGTPIGGPLIGAAVWAADKIMGDKIQEVHRLQYQIAGTWQSPQVEEVKYRINPFTLLDW